MSLRTGDERINPKAGGRLPALRPDWIGSALGLAGACLLAANIDGSEYGWVLFLLSNAAWIIYGTRLRTWSLVTMQVGFTGTSMLGIWRWLA